MVNDANSSKGEDWNMLRYDNSEDCGSWTVEAAHERITRK